MIQVKSDGYFEGGFPRKQSPLQVWILSYWYFLLETRNWHY